MIAEDIDPQDEERLVDRLATLGHVLNNGSRRQNALRAFCLEKEVFVEWLAAGSDLEVGLSGHVIDCTLEGVQRTVNGNSDADENGYAKGDAHDSQPRFPLFAEEVSQGKKTD